MVEGAGIARTGARAATERFDAAVAEPVRMKVNSCHIGQHNMLVSFPILAEVFF